MPAMAALLAVGMAAVLLTREPPLPPRRRAAAFESAVLAPFADFLRARRRVAAILVFVVLYKFGDALAGVMSNPFYVALGFSKIEIANVAKVFGLAASIAGVIARRRRRLSPGRDAGAAGLRRAADAVEPHVRGAALGRARSVGMLALTIAIENVTGGMSSAAFVAYLSRLCNPAFTATQYALLSALAATPRTVFAVGRRLVRRPARLGAVLRAGDGRCACRALRCCCF